MVSSGLWVEMVRSGLWEEDLNLVRGIRRKAAASPLSGAVGGAKPSGLCEVISYVFKNENLH